MRSSKSFYKKKRIILPVFIILSVLIGDLIIISMTHGESKAVDEVRLDNTIEDLNADQIKVMTINMAHGRANGRSQIFQSKATIEKNIENVGQLIAKENAQVVALQEADAPSWWSGQFSHVDRVGTIGGMVSAVQGLNIDGLGLHYGTAVVTQLEVSAAHQVTFKKNVPSFSKGFVVVTCTWPNDPSYEFDVVSLHLDFASAKIRSNQISILADLVNESVRPIILMGDFNTDMSKELLPKLINDTGLQAWRADDTSIITFPALGSRIDWIFASPELRIVEQRVLDDTLSDHRVVVATLERKN